MRYSKLGITIFGVLLTLAVSSSAWAQDPGWPRQFVRPGGTLVVYQPQVDDWTNYTDLKWRMAFSADPHGRQASCRSFVGHGVHASQHRHTHGVCVQHQY